ncbi:hypothetical protein BX257_0923 [Streptomyces sp. 3212.3]|uniref:hypothetical protein n=1 Tax=Streptomyces sp. 3212.3 TaxID=1938846 RepID=UPI000E373208|nr:hypothetical protein [Streptomyces sp. 3212.3]REE58498.1 hypothetical protein BX257_0923 [Streptomyces sp. 3212.3]
MLRNLMGPRTLRRCAPAAAALTVLAATPAMAGNVWQIQTANSPPPAPRSPVAAAGS